MHENYLSEQIIGCCITIHKLLGPGLLESVYEEALAYELNRKALKCSRQKDISVDYKDVSSISALELTSLWKTKCLSN